MRTSLLNLDEATAKSPAQPPAKPSAPAPPEKRAQDKPAEEDIGDFEIVLGRRQIASTGLLLMAAVVCFSGVSYLIGRSAAGKTGGSLAPAPEPAVQAPVAAAQIPVAAKPPAKTEPAASLPAASAAVVTGAASVADQSPLFAEAVTGKVYIQVGAVDKGLAGVWAEGLRTHGLNAFVSTGPSDKMWRVLIGPLPDPQAYQQAKNTLDQLGISTFGRRYTDQPAAPKIPANEAPAPQNSN